MSAARTPATGLARLELRSGELADTLAIGRAVAKLCRDGDVLALAGELGAGKTQLVRGLADGLGIDASRVASPTFVFLHEYEPEPEPPPTDDASRPLTLVHLDAYRLTSDGDLATIGFDLDDPDFRAGTVVTVEWPERLGGSIDPGLTLKLQHAPPSRRITVTVHGPWRDRVDALQHELAAFEAP